MKFRIVMFALMFLTFTGGVFVCADSGAPPPGYAVVHLIRPNVFVGSAVPMRIDINGVSVAELPNGSRCSIRVEAGRTLIEAYIASWIGNTVHTIAAGSELFIRFDFAMGWSENRITPVILDSQGGGLGGADYAGLNEVNPMVSSFARVDSRIDPEIADVDAYLEEIRIQSERQAAQLLAVYGQFRHRTAEVEGYTFAGMDAGAGLLYEFCNGGVYLRTTLGFLPIVIGPDSVSTDTWSLDCSMISGGGWALNTEHACFVVGAGTHQYFGAYSDGFEVDTNPMFIGTGAGISYLQKFGSNFGILVSAEASYDFFSPTILIASAIAGIDIDVSMFTASAFVGVAWSF